MNGRVIRDGGQLIRPGGRLVGNCTCCGDCIPLECQTLRVTIAPGTFGVPTGGWWDGTRDVVWCGGCRCDASWSLTDAEDPCDTDGATNLWKIALSDDSWGIESSAFGSFGATDPPCLDSETGIVTWPWEVAWPAGMTVECVEVPL